jgi:tight adherence protein B
MDSQDFRWTISALTIQREIGGNLSDILSTTANAIRGRAEIRNEVKALSAEGRMSAYVLISIPIFMLLYLRLTRPEAFGLMFSTAPGLIMMAIVLVLMIIGWAWVQKVVNIKL